MMKTLLSAEIEDILFAEICSNATVKPKWTDETMQTDIE